MLRIAVPNKGSLSESAVTMLRESGYRTRRDTKELILRDADNDIEFFYLRPRDIATYVGSGTLHGGITGRDLLVDSGSDAVESLPLGFARSTFRFAGKAGDITALEQLEGKRVATSYSGLVRDHLEKQGVEATVVHLDGAVETSITLGVADAIADVVETGTTLRNQGLEVFGEPIIKSEAVLIGRAEMVDDPAFQVFRRRMQGIVTARTYVMMDYDIRADLVDAASKITPGLESPTVSPLRDEGHVAVRVMVPRKGVNNIMDELYQIGARAILVTDITVCRV
ncbi:MAG: ATP phosphoribosyltransferase [Dermatophilus congolensis]|nr:ATP phosphoribosyltransferase [Dermatophilus congolensis]